jgi:hypothetical protein
MGHALSIEELMRTTKTELLSPEELAGDGTPLDTDDFELVEVRDLEAPEPRPALVLVAARPEATPVKSRGAVATLSGAVKIAAPPYLGETVRLPRVDEPHPQNRRLSRTPRHTMILPRTRRPRVVTVARRLLASAARHAGKESREMLVGIRAESVKLWIVLGLVTSAFLLGALAVQANTWLAR